MKKRALAFTLAAAMVAGSVAGCGSAAEAPTSAASAGTETTAAAAETTAAGETTAAAEEAAAADDWASKIELKDSAKNPAAPDWSEYDKLIDEIRSDTDLADREAKMHEAEDMLMATGAVLPIYYYNDLYLAKEGIEGDYATIFGTKYFMYAKKDGQPMDVFNINLAKDRSGTC